MMKAFLMTILLLPSAAWAQGVSAEKEVQEFFQFYSNNFLQVEPGTFNEFELYKDGSVLHGFVSINGSSTTTTTDLISLTRTITGHVRKQFAIPKDYQWVLEEGGFYNVPAVRPIAEMRMVQFNLTVDGVPLEEAFVKVMFDPEGHTQTITMSIPRLRPDTVKAVRSAKVTPAQVQAAIQADAKAMPPGNEFRVDPSKDVDWKNANLRKVAGTRPPYVAYTCMVEEAFYTVDATTGKVMGKRSLALDTKPQ